jgi:ferrous iron transport protein A
MVLLADLRVGDRVRILGFNSAINQQQKVYQQRLLDLGLVPATEFLIVRVAPLGDPVEIRFHNFSLCIRKREGAILQLERIRDV